MKILQQTTNPKTKVLAKQFYINTQGARTKQRERKNSSFSIFIYFVAMNFFYAKKGVLAKKGDYIAYNHVLQSKDGTLVTQLWIHESCQDFCCVNKAHPVVG
jgi:hypothetical protein